VKRGLGRGLDALLPSSRPSAAAPAPAPQLNDGTREIATADIDRNPYQTRLRVDEAALNELAASIRATGVVQPILVRPVTKDGRTRYQLIAGERRWLASQRAGKQSVPAVIKQVSNEQAMEMTIVENLQRTDLNPMEQARAYSRLSREFSLTQEQMAERTGKDRASVTNFLRLLKLPQPVQEMVESGDLTFGHARALLALSSAPEILAAAARIATQNMSVRQTETYIKDLMNPEQRPAKPEKVKEPLDPNVREARDLIQRKLGLRVHVEDKHGKGRVIIEYANVDDFDMILRSLGE